MTENKMIVVFRAYGFKQFGMLSCGTWKGYAASMRPLTNRSCNLDVAVRPQASFLVWLDCRGLGLDHDALIDLFVNKARLALNDGEAFGPGGEGHMRMNVGAPRALLAEALDRLKEAVENL